MHATRIAFLSVLLAAALVLAQAATESEDSLQLHDGETIHDESIESLSEESDYGSDNDEDSDDEDESEDDFSDLSEDEIAQLQEEIKIYGNYCGPGYCGGQNVQEQSGKCNWSVQPIDSLDACCKVHDKCCGSAATRNKSCNQQILACASKAKCAQSSTTKWAECEIKKMAVKATFAAAKNQVCGEIMDKVKNSVDSIKQGLTEKWKSAKNKVISSLGGKPNPSQTPQTKSFPKPTSVSKPATVSQSKYSKPTSKPTSTFKPKQVPKTMIKPKSSQPKSSQPKSSQPKSSKPKSSKPKSSKPKASKPKSSKPKSSKPKSSKPKSSKPE
jgi:hypothetical protein